MGPYFGMRLRIFLVKWPTLLLMQHCVMYYFEMKRIIWYIFRLFYVVVMAKLFEHRSSVFISDVQVRHEAAEALGAIGIPDSQTFLSEFTQV